MAKATISLLKLNGIIETIDCDSGGNLSEAGWILYSEYRDIEKIQSLIKLGSLIKLRKNIENDPQGENCVFKQRDYMILALSEHYTLTQYKEKMGQNIHKHYIFDETHAKWKILNIQTLELTALNFTLLNSPQLKQNQHEQLEHEMYEENIIEQHHKIENQLSTKLQKKGKKI